MNYSKHLVQLSVLISAITSVFWLQLIDLNSNSNITNEISEEHMSQPDIHMLDSSLGSLGYAGLSASVLWLDFIQYYGSPFRQQNGYALADVYLTRMTEREPRFASPYRMTTSALAFRGGKPEHALEILENGIEYLSPEINSLAYTAPFEAGTISFLYLGDGERGLANYQLAADWFEASTGESAQHWREIGNRLYRNPRSRRIQFDVWFQAYQVNPDPDAREFILERLATLGEVRRHPNGQIQVIPPPEDS